MNEDGKKSYGQILKSSALVGGSTAITLVLGLVRTKVMAVLLGPAGFGLFGIYSSISDLVRSIAGMGINSSGVREIAEAAGSGDSKRLAQTVITLRRVSVFLGALGAVLLVLFAAPIAKFSFEAGEDAKKYVVSVALLAIAVFFTDVAAGQTALVQGMRRVADLARMNVLGALFGTIFSIGIVYYFWSQGEPRKGIVPSLICVAVMALATSWWYSRKIKIEPVSMSVRDVARESSELLKLGFAFMANGLMGLGAAYLIRIMVLHKIGEDAAGYYQAAWTLGGQYVMVILQAMGADFYPRLVAAGKDNKEVNRLVNEQAEIGMLLAGPGVLATLTFAPIVIGLFFSTKFGPSVELLRWICLGLTLRVVSWPMGFVVLAKGARHIFFWAEVVSNSILLGLTWLCVIKFGLKGTGIGFFGLYVFHVCMTYCIARRLSGFRWSRASVRIGLIFVVLIAAVFTAWYFVPHLWASIGGVIVTILAGIYSLKTLCTLVPLERLPGPARKMLTFLRLARPNANG